MADGLYVFRLGTATTGEIMAPPGNAVICENNSVWLHGCLRAEPRREVVVLAEGLCDLGGHFG